MIDNYGNESDIMKKIEIKSNPIVMDLLKRFSFYKLSSGL